MKLENVSRKFSGQETPAVDGVSLTLGNGEILALVGESGSGKSTLLRLIAGLEVPDAGSITVNNQCVADSTRWIPTEKRNIGFVFQDGALFPHLSVAANVAYGLDRKRKNEHQAVVTEMLNLVGLQGFEDRFPHQLSGGERQRLALARAIAPRPKILLLDEPFSNLDPDLRRTMREEIHQILRKVNASAIMVTHDTEDALIVGDRVAVFRDGRIEQSGSPVEIFQNPKNEYCARLFGPANRVIDPITGDERLVRPNQMTLVELSDEPEAIPVTIQRIKPTGKHTEAVVEWNDTDDQQKRVWTLHLSSAEDFQPNQKAAVILEYPKKNAKVEAVSPLKS